MRNSTPCSWRRFGQNFLSAALILGLLVPGLLLPWGCAPKKIQAPEPADSWELFTRRFSRLPDGVRAFKITASLFYSESGKGHRTVLDLWGDFNGPVRLDVQAGVGAALAFVRDGGPDNTGWLAVLPRENKAYVHPDPLAGQAALGIPLPFTLHHLARLACGDYSFLVPSAFDRAEPRGDDTIYRFTSGPASGLASSLALDKNGLPVEITGPAADPWILTPSRFTDEGTGPPYPEKMELVLPEGGKAVLRIKSREFKVAPWPQGTLDLPVPGNVPTLQINPEYEP